MKRYLVYLTIFIWAFHGHSQTETEALLNAYANDHPELQETITIDISGLTIYEFLNSVALEHKINLSARFL